MHRCVLFPGRGWRTASIRSIIVSMPAKRPKRAKPPSERGSKICVRCARPFTWRKKWERDWEQVKYCSDRCRMGKAS